MTRIVFVFGAIAGAIVVAMFFITMPLYKSGVLNHDNGAIIGYSTMVIALSTTIFFGVKSYRDNELAGTITFWRAAQVGLLITLVAGFVYATGWEFYLKLVAPNFMDEYATMAIDKAKSKGASEAEILQITNQMNNIREMYKSFFLRFAMTLMEILPVGIIIAFLGAGILRKKEFLPA